MMMTLPHRWQHALLALTLSATLSACARQAAEQPDAIADAVSHPQRTAAFVARDAWRNPHETLTFFDVTSEMTVVEIWPGGGWYTEILAPLLRDHGTLYAAHFNPASPVSFFQRSHAAFHDKLSATPALYDQVQVTVFDPPGQTAIAPAGSADRVVTFRNVHNWAQAGNAEAAFSAFYTALKPGGILGVVEHRAPAERSFGDQIKSGYMTEEYVITLAEQAGFVLQASSEINANPADTANHPAGVWTLPPTLRLGDTDRARYQRIGESDRMTLKFVKPR